MTERLDIMDIEPDFSHHSNFNDKAGVAGVKFGADAPVLEVELNELQQIQDLAREDLIRSMIPSGFTKVPEIDFSLSTLTTLVTANDAEAYVNGMRIFIPKGTVIDIGEAPEKESREDLIFLEVWKEEVGGRETLNQYGGEGQPHTQNTIIDIREKEETSHRVINRWRIRHVADVDFETHPNGLRVSGEIWNPIQCYAQGKNDKPLDKVNQEDSIYYSYSIFSQYTDSSDWKGYNYYKSDHTLAIAGCFNSQKAKEKIGSVDGLAFAIPMFKLQRRPKSGFKRGSYDLIAPTADPVKVNNVVKEERVAGVSTGEVDMMIKGKTLKNEFFVGEFSDLDAKIRYENLNKDIKQDVPYTVINTSDKPIVLDINKILGNNFVTQIEIPANSYKIHKYTQETYSFICSGVKSSGWSTDNKEQLKKACIILEGIYEVANLNHFEGIKSSGEEEVAFKEFINYPCSTTKGTATNLATFNYKPKSNLIRVVPVKADGTKVTTEPQLAYKLLDKDGSEVVWNTSADQQVLTDEQKGKTTQIRIFTSNQCESYNIIGFNIYDGYSIKYVARIDEDRETVKEFRLKEPLRGLPNGVCDTINKDGIVVRRIGKLILNGQEEWQKITSRPDTNTLFLQTSLTSPNSFVLCNNMPSKSGDYLWQNDEQGIGTNKDSRIQIRVNRTQLNTQDVEGFKKWLKDNPLEVYYEKKLYEPLVELQNGVTDVDNRLGEVTRYSNTVICNGSEDWTIDLGATQSLNLMRFSLRKHDRLDTIDGHSNLMDLVCPNIPVANDRGSTPPPRLWSYWKDTIYLDVIPTSVGIDFNVDSDETKLSKFKAWLKANPVTISYQLAEPKLETYETEKAEVIGDLYFNNENAEIISKNNIPPELTLKHKADMNLDIYKDITHISCDSNIPATITCEGETGENFLDLTPSEDKKQVPVKLEGETYYNHVKNVTIQATGGVIQDEIIVIDNSTPKDGGVMLETEILKPSTKYSIIYNVLENKNYQGILKLDNFSSFYPPVEQLALSTKAGKNIIVFNTKPSFDKQTVKIVTSNNQSIPNSVLKISKNIVILEGDYANKYSPSYFEGIKSVGESGGKVGLISRGENLVDFTMFTPSSETKIQINSDNIILEGNRQYANMCVDLTKLNLIEGKAYYTSIEVENIIGNQVYHDIWINDKSTAKRDFIYKKGDKVKLYIFANRDIFPSKSIIRKIMVSNKNMEYVPYRGNRKAFNLPIPYGLKGLPNGTKDFIEKRKDGYYLVQRVETYTFTDKQEVIIPESQEGVNTILIYFRLDNAKANQINLISNLLPSINNNKDVWNPSTIDYPCISINHNRDLLVRISKANLTSKDKNAIKKYFIDNNFTVYYELAEPVEYKLTSTLVTNSESAEFALEGQVDYKKAWNGGANLNRITLTGAYPYSTWLETSKSRVFSYELKEGEDATELLNVPLVPVKEALEGEKPLTQYSLSVLELLPDNKCLIRCNLDMVGGQGTEYYCVPSQFSSKVCAKDVESLCKRVSLTGWDYNQVLEETLFNLLK